MSGRMRVERGKEKKSGRVGSGRMGVERGKGVERIDLNLEKEGGVKRKA